jgi:hypothetical protein
MNMPKWLNWNNAMKVVVGVVGVAGAVVTAPSGVLPAVIVGAAMKVVTYGGILAGIGAAKYLPGHGPNAPEKPLEMPKQ